MSRKKRSSKNLKIGTRITISAVVGILVPVIILIAFSSVFQSFMASYFGFATVTTNEYSAVNQLQWSQTITSISNELVSDSSEEAKVKKINEFVAPLEKLGSVIYIEKNGAALYATTSKSEVTELASSIVKTDTQRNTNYFGENGMVIVNHVNDGSDRYVVIIANENYTVNDVSKRFAPQNITHLLFSRTGILILLIASVFIIAIIIISFITSKTINKPLRELSYGANEIANGNLDYVIDYDSTNEIGVTVKSFNHMTDRLKQSLERQQTIEQSRKEMIAGVAHDLRTPLTSVKGYVEGLRDGIANTPEKQELYLKTIYTSTLNMEHLLDELLTVSRLELGNIELECKPVNINDFLDDCAGELKAELQQHDFDFNYTNNCDSDFTVMLDAERFHRVIRNIISNSLKYAKKDEKGRIELTAQTYQKSVIITLADNGIGIEGENLTKIFESFYRADPARTKTSEGSGIGLSVARQIVELHGGKIWATGKEGKGLTILISMPRKVEENE
ncbi:MAG: HAMP domain-containing histidine kinase [Eubacterium sp.]|nr:HAMP domain-containing histidine kinase [Eubacterium sp.]